MDRFFICFFLGLLATTGHAHPKTSLGDAGDQEVAERYNAFEAHNLGCSTNLSGPRVLVTGFGLFEGLNFNLSGAIATNLANTSFWPTDVEPDGTYQVPSQLAVADGVLQASDGGARIYNRSFQIGGR